MKKNSNNKTTRTRYNNVYKDYKGVIFFSVCLGKDENGKRITKKNRKSLKTASHFKQQNRQTKNCKNLLLTGKGNI